MGALELDLGPRSPAITLGRDEACGLVLDDPSISRRHGQLLWVDGQACYEDLGSRNGSRLNGTALRTRASLREGDVLQLGDVHLTLTTAATAPAEDGSQWLSLGEALEPLRTLDLQGGPSVGGTLALLQDISLDLLHDDAQEQQLKRVLERLLQALEPRRIVVLLREPAGELVAAVSVPHSEEALPVSRTAVKTLCESRQALLIKDRNQDLRVKDASSLLAMQVRSLMAVPLESQGSVEGILYAEAGYRRKPFDRRDLALLATVAHMLAARIRTSRLLREQDKARLLDKEMGIARKMQRDLLPMRDPVAPAFEFLGRSTPSSQVSGDLFGYWQPSEHRWYAALADVSGKGAGPGLLMACLVAYMDAFTLHLPSTTALATDLSAALARHTTSNRFATAFLCALDPTAGWIEYTNAGHNPGLLVRVDGSITPLGSHGLALATLPGLRPYHLSRVELAPGDFLFLNTDGITEATDALDEEFGQDRLEAFLTQQRALPLEGLLDALQAVLEAHVGSRAFKDDRTVLVLRRTGPG